jgi:hypothetical protein
MIIFNSKNKTKIIWSIIKTITRSEVNVHNISLINVIDSLTNDSQLIANAFNKYFLIVVENLIVENVKDKNSSLNNTNS